MSDEALIEKIARIDANVQTLMHSVPTIHKLDIESAVNIREHRIAISIAIVLGLPAMGWVFKKLEMILF